MDRRSTRRLANLLLRPLAISILLSKALLRPGERERARGGSRLGRRTGFVLIVASLLVSAHASALPPYPGAVQTFLGQQSPPITLQNPPDCCLCHTNSCMAGGTALNAFGSLLVQYGLPDVPNNPTPEITQLNSALQELEQNAALYTAVTNDLKSGTDPTADAATSNLIDEALNGQALPQPQFGCGGQLAPARPAPRQMWVAALVGVLVACGRRAKRARRTRS
jgi:hypothetical protein